MQPTAPPAEWREDIQNWLDYLKSAGYSAETLKTRRCKMTFISERLHGTPSTTTGDDLVALFASRDWMPETRKGYRNTVSSFFSWMQNTGRRTDNPAAMLPSVRKPQPQPRPCPDRHIKLALSRATESEAIMVRLAAECGLRRHEIAKAHSDDVMGQNGCYSLRIVGKGGVQRIVPLPDDLAAQILAADGWVFPGRFSGHASASHIGEHVSSVLPEGWAAHSLRHRYATRLYSATRDIFLVRRLLGHASVETTQAYVAMDDDDLRNGMDAVLLS